MTDTEKLVVAILTAARIAKDGGATSRVVTLYGEIAIEMEKAGHFGARSDQGQRR